MPAALTHLPQITRWIKGLVTQRNPIDTPFSIVGMNVVAHNDALFDGENIEVTSNNTLMRRWGLTQWMATPLPPMNTVDGFWSFRNLKGVLRTIATTDKGLYWITPSGFTIINFPLTFSGVNPWSVATTGDYAYFANGAFDAMGRSYPVRWQPDHPVASIDVFKWGINPPTVAPIVTATTAGVNAWTSHFIPVADLVAGTFFVNQPDTQIQFNFSVVGTTLTITWLYTGYPIGPGPITNTTSTTLAGTTANIAVDAENGQSTTVVEVTGITPTIAGLATALNNNTSLIVSTYGSPQANFARLQGNVIAPGGTFAVSDGDALGVNLSPKSDPPVVGIEDLTNTNYDLQMRPGTQPIISFFRLPFITLTDVISGSVTFSTRTDHGAFTNTTVNVPASPNNNVTGLSNAILAAIPGSVVMLPKTGTTAQLSVLPDVPGVAGPNTTWTISANSLNNDTVGAPLTWESVDTNFAAIRPINQIQLGVCWRNETTGHVSTMGPSVAFESKAYGSWLTVLMPTGNTQDPQVSYPELYVTADGGSSFLLPPQFRITGGLNTTFLLFTGDDQLNPQIAAPLDFANAPPPSGMKGVVTHTQRKWGIVDNLVYYSAGPDCLNGLGDEAWPPANNFSFPGPVTKIESTANGLMVFLNDDLHVIEGVDSSSYFAHPFAYNFGISNPRAEFYDGQTMFIYTTSRQLHAVSPGNQDEIGYDISDQLQQFFDPALTKVVVHRGPSTDFALFISNGVDKMFRYAPNKGWSPVGQYDTTTIGAIGSIETAPGLIQLLVAPSSPVAPAVYFRDYTSYQDNNVPYTAFATIGGIALTNPGEEVPVNNIILQMTAAGSDPNVSILLNELTGNFQQLSAKDGPIFDPVNRPPSTTLRQKRWWSPDSLEPIIERANTLFIRLDFAAENAKSEVLSLFARSGK